MEDYCDHRQVLNVLFHQQEPEIFECAHHRHGHQSKQCMLPGIMVEILALVAKKGRFRLNFTIDPAETYDYDDTCQRLNNDKIDIFGFTVRPTQRLQQSCDFSASLYMVIWKVGRLQLFQPEPFYFKLRSGACSISLFALFQGSLMLGIYSSCCLSALIRQPNYNEMRRESYVYDQLRKGKRKLLSWGPLYKFRERIFNRTEQAYLELQRAVGSHGLESHWTTDSMLDSFIHHNNFIYDYKTSGIGLMALEFCDTMIADIRYPEFSRHLMMSKNNTHKPVIDKIIRENQPKIRAIYDSYIKRKSQHKCSKFRVGNPLKLNYYYGLLIVCGVAMTIATLIFFWETLYQRYHYYRRTKISKNNGFTFKKSIWMESW
ncbi:unnamed protein product [Bursaphelenchus xylophilus]|uniref:(pine wood nematode) hypothetical protein n=1 Tax=Bursaphelenchus xylophilus TaxID=6326 RepID=A0A1I7RJK2_BURXY|nr:unnamed protein product [Bursaphelenchus xylophilus]CAG9128926.1 unnamed protein product [Bursaphelenchus xylophilus]